MNVLDLGSNSFKLTTFKKMKNSYVVVKEKRVFAELQNKNFIKFDNELIQYIVANIQKLIEETKNDNLTFAFATHAFRKKENTIELLSTLKEKTNIDLEILTEQQEIEMGWYANLLLIKKNKYLLLVDIGGGSLEISYFIFGKIFYYNSFALGIWNLYQKDKNPANHFNIVQNCLKKLVFVNKNTKVYFISGVFKSVLNFMNCYVNVNNDFLSRDDLNIFFKQTMMLDLKVISKIDSKINPLIIKSGYSIILAILKIFYLKNAYFSSNSIRKGYLLYKLNLLPENICQNFQK